MKTKPALMGEAGSALPLATVSWRLSVSPGLVVTIATHHGGVGGYDIDAGDLQVKNPQY